MICKRFFHIAVFFFLLALFAGGCTTPSGKSTGEAIDDAAITTKVKAMLIDTFAAKGFSIRVSTYRGTVQLSGFVDTPLQKQRAADIARRIYGVRKVINNIVIRGQ